MLYSFLFLFLSLAGSRVSSSFPFQTSHVLLASPFRLLDLELVFLEFGRELCVVVDDVDACGCGY